MSLPYGLKLKFSAILDSMSKTSPKPSVSRAPRKRVFGQGEKKSRAGLYARVSTHDQQTLPMQLAAMRDYARKRGWDIAVEVKDVGSGAVLRQKREELLAAARRREIDLVVVWRLDRWGRSLVDLVNTLQELVSLKVGFVSLSEALDLTTASGRAKTFYWTAHRPPARKMVCHMADMPVSLFVSPRISLRGKPRPQEPLSNRTSQLGSIASPVP
jgi:Resolvase, N terminal domain